MKITDCKIGKRVKVNIPKDKSHGREGLIVSTIHANKGFVGVDLFDNIERIYYPEKLTTPPTKQLNKEDYELDRFKHRIAKR